MQEDDAEAAAPKKDDDAEKAGLVYAEGAIPMPVDDGDDEDTLPLTQLPAAVPADAEPPAGHPTPA